MGAETRLSGKGQLVIPADVRERRGLRAGDRFEVIEDGDDLRLRRIWSGARARLGPPLSIEEMLAGMPRYEGPRLSVDDIEAAAEAGLTERMRRKMPDLF